jgi:hypothetical protein
MIRPLAVLAAAGALLAGLSATAVAAPAAAGTAATDGAGVMACAWTENVDSWIMGHNECPYAVKWEIGLPDPLAGPTTQATYTRCVEAHGVRDIARRGTPLKGTVRC